MLELTKKGTPHYGNLEHGKMNTTAKAEEDAEAMVEVTNLATKKAMEAKAEGAAEVREAMDAMKAGIINTTSLNATKKAVDTKAEEAAEALEAVMTNATKKTV